LFDDDDDARRFMSRDECTALAARVLKFTAGGGQTNLNIRSTWDGELRWAKNRPTVTGDRRDNMVQIARIIRGATGNVNTNQTDDESLKAAVAAAERILTHFPESPEDIPDPPTKHTYPETRIWSKGTYDQAPAARGEIVHRLVEPTRAKGMVSAGYLSVAAAGNAYIDSQGRSLYAPQTYAECSITVRDPKGAGSGWAGASSYDWARFDAAAIAAVAR